jgi:uncharacterized metal-binding protein YceD (DUF177 family)
LDKPHFVVPVADLASSPRRLRWEISEDWLRWALTDSGAAPRNGPGELRVELTKNGPQVIVRGQAQVAVTMPCVRTLDPVDIELAPDIFLMLEPAASEQKPRQRRKPHDPAPAGPGRPRKRKGPSWRETPELSPEGAAQDTYDGEQIVLDQFVREFLLLEVPMSPVRTTLPNDPEPATGDAESSEGTSTPLDPRLMPLLAIKSRLQNQKE